MSRIFARRGARRRPSGGRADCGPHRAIRVPRVGPYDVVRIMGGSLLLVAAGLTAHQLVSEGLGGLGSAERSDGFFIFASPWLPLGAAVFEAGLGLLLSIGVWAKATRVACVAAFGVFATVSFYEAIGGEASCGCFGRLAVSPWWKFGVDVAVLGALVACRPCVKPIASGPDTHPRFLGLRLLLGAVPGAVVVLGPLAVCGTAFDGSLEPAVAALEGYPRVVTSATSHFGSILGC